MSQNQECYRYAAPGERSLKRHHTHQPQQVCYLQGLEIRTSATRAREASRLLVLVSGNCRIYQQGSDIRAHFNLGDRLGNISVVVDAQGDRVSQETWYPFGGTASWLTGNQTGAEIKFQRYAGKERDATGLIAYGWRYFAPWLMRWLNSDPAGTVDGLNLFRMVSNNPVTLFDRDGRMKSWLTVALEQVQDENMSSRLQNLPVSQAPEAQPVASTSAAIDLPAGVSPSNTILTAAASFYPPLPGISGSLQRFTETPLLRPQGEASPAASSPMEMAPEQKPHFCTVGDCNKSYSNKKQLNKHIKRVHGEKKFTCDRESCDKGFTTSDYLKRHKETHDAPRTFFCSYSCGASFTRRYNLTAHEKTHQLREKLPCRECAKTFSTKSSLTRHIKDFHK